MPVRPSGLDEYARKRAFDRTPEPSGVARPAPAPRRGALSRFVIQEHHARRLHWDFRLEMEGVLRSWAVPKGLSMDPRDKRLAVAVEDHPLEYVDFEGVIPEGNYGAGTVMVWDAGTYECLEGDPAAAYAKGKLTLRLQGEKVRGEFHMVRTRMPARGGAARVAGADAEPGDKAQWLIFKKSDGDAVSGWTMPSPSVSVKTGRTIEQIKAEASARWLSGDPASASRKPGAPGRRAEDALRRALRAIGLPARGGESFPSKISPMLATTRDEPFDDPRWLFEIKWDGIRAIAHLRRQDAEQQVTLRSRGGLAINAQYPEVVEALYALDLPDAVLDGEIVALDSRGRAQFQLLQARLHGDGANTPRAAPKPPIVYYVFDLLYVGGHLLMERPLVERRKVLEALLPSHRTVRLSQAEPAAGRAFYDAAHRLGIEGVIAKSADRPYEPGKRTAHWVKIKVKQRLEAVVAGYTKGQRARAKTFGALLLGAYDDHGTLRYIGHAGGGFTDSELRRVFALLQARRQDACPFPEVPPTNAPPAWVRPELVAEVEHGGWTADGLLRFPVYRGLRDDRPAHQVRLERPVVSGGGSPSRGPGAPNGEGAGSAKAHVKGGGRAEDRGRAARERAGARDTRNPGAGTKMRGARAPGPRPEAVAAAPGDARSVGQALAAAGVPVEFTNLDKVFWPQRGYTKGDLIRYYLAVSETILPYLRGRPLTLRRFPDGIAGPSFYQKNYPDAPSFVRLVDIWTESSKERLSAPVGGDVFTLLWLAQLACVEMHAWFSRITPARRSPLPEAGSTDFAVSEEALRGSVLNLPDFVVLDIDPYIFPDGKLPTGRGEKDPDYTRRGFDAALEAALLLREVLTSLRLESFVKTSGKTGLHIFVPIARRYTFEETHAFAKTLTRYLAARHPEKVTTAWAVEQRVGKVFLDYNQNRLGATLAGAYSVRPTPQATVSMPLTWEELGRGIDPLAFTMETAPDLVRRRGDPWKDLLARPQRLDHPLKP
ncbi:MAG: hypothetical protein HY660_00785 [Armatimonadetes bacterium]|nr:hypothetical protein [Armatimonadota bacterium]